MKRLVFAAIVLIGVYGFVEVSAWVGLGRVSGGSFSLSQAQAERDAILAAAPASAGMREEAPPEAGEVRVGLPDNEYLHPYLGFDNGRQTREPRQRSADVLLVGVFGGSFAGAFATSGALERELAKLPAFADREIVVRKMAAGGYKQPQQLMSLAYLFARGGELDVVVNLDGFNEVALHRMENGLTGVAAIYPRKWYTRVRSLPVPELRRLVGLVTYLESQRVDMAGLFSRGPTGSPLWNLVWKLRDRWLSADIAAAQEAFQRFRREGLTREISGPVRVYADEGEMYDDLVEIWARSSVQMHRLASANGVPYLHIIQPNQYVPGSKPMGADERARAFHENYRCRADIEQGYPRLIREAKRLAERGVPVFDLTMVFEAEEEPLYADPCCHLGGAGNRLFAARIAPLIAAALEAGSAGGAPSTGTPRQIAPAF